MEYFLLSLVVVLTTLFIIVRVKTGGLYGLFTKILASVGFVSLALYCSYVKGLKLVSFFIVLGLIFGLIGDILLDLKIIYDQHNDEYLNAGMLSFGIGHLMYMGATIVYSNSIFVQNINTLFLALIGVGFAGIVTIFIAVFGEKILKLNFGKNKIQSLCYTFILSFMSAFSIVIALYKPVFLVFALGILFIFISDLVLSVQYFGDKKDSKLFTILNHAIYYIGQIAIAFSILFIL